jgi:hypothetical protein
MPGFADADTEPPGNLKCGICMLTANEPVMCKNQHLFCRSCISQWLTQKEACPTCKEGLTVGTLTAHRMAADNIAELRVCCDSKLLQEDAPSAKKQMSGAKSAASVGCDWVGRMRELNQHKESCEYVEVRCRHGGGCEWKGRRGAAQEHEVSCDYRMEACQHCNEDCRVRRMLSHERGCRKRPVVCRNGGCDSSHPYEDLIQHLAVCSKQPNKCPYHESLSCSFSCTREDMPAHADDAAAHFKSLMGVLQSTRDENKALVEKVNALVCTTAREVRQLRGFQGYTPTNQGEF